VLVPACSRSLSSIREVRPTVHDHDTHPLDRHVGPPHVERFVLTKAQETIAVVCTCAIGADHDNTIRPVGAEPAG